MREVTHDPLDRIFHAVEAFEGFVELDGAVEEDAPEPAVLRGIHKFGFADRGHHALRRARIEHLVVARREQPVSQAHGFEALAGIVPRKDIEDVKCAHHSNSFSRLSTN